MKTSLHQRLKTECLSFYSTFNAMRRGKTTFLVHEGEHLRRGIFEFKRRFSPSKQVSSQRVLYPYPPLGTHPKRGGFLTLFFDPINQNPVSGFLIGGTSQPLFSAQSGIARRHSQTAAGSESDAHADGRLYKIDALCCRKQQCARPDSILLDPE